MSTKNNGGSAFPREIEYEISIQPLDFSNVGSMDDVAKATEDAIKNADRGHGMSLRDYFAGHALAGMFANDAMITRYGAHAKDNLIDPDVLTATAAYSIADAMISERSK